jgi:hypothetical protein
MLAASLLDAFWGAVGVSTGSGPQWRQEIISMSGRESPGVLTIVVEVCMLAAFVELGRILVVAVQTGEMWFGVKEGQFPITLAMSPVLFSVLCIVCVVAAGSTSEWTIL